MDTKNPFTSFLKLDEIFPQEKNKTRAPTVLPLTEPTATPTTDLHTSTTSAPLPQSFTPQAVFSPKNLYAFSKILEIKNKIASDLLDNSKYILELNRSRRKSLLIHLEKLSGEFHKAHLEADDIKTRELLKRWVEGYQNPGSNYTLTEQQKEAFKIYLQESTYYFLGLILIYKSWSDRGLVKMSEPDLEVLPTKITNTLKPYVSLERENWKIVCRNLYSWYKPKKKTCVDIWQILQSFNISQELDDYIPSLFEQLSEDPLAPQQLKFYDHRFYQSFWKYYPSFFGTPKKSIKAFTPTFRNGAFAYFSPENFEWYGFEASPFSLITAEFFYLFSHPRTPHYLETGYGFEAHSKEQLSLTLSHSPSTLSLITEMGACDFASIFEEKKLSPTEKSATSWELKETLESIPFYKNLKNEHSNIGILQTCLSLSKIRPGGLCFWFRETPLHFTDGVQSIEFIFSKAELMCEWDFSEVSHQLPVNSKIFPNYIYVLKKELDTKKRNMHRPRKIKVSGNLRSHIELPHLLEEAWTSYFTEKKEFLGQWKIHCFTSTSPQEDWLTQWPESSSQKDIDLVSEMKTNTLPLGQVGLIRNLSTHTKETTSPLLLKLTENRQSHTIWISTQSSESAHQDERVLSVTLTPPPFVNKTTFSISFSNKNFIAPLQCYLLSEKVQKWLDLNVERKKNKWQITEQHLKLLPVPESLLYTLQNEDSDFHAPHWSAIEHTLFQDKKMTAVDFSRLIEKNYPTLSKISLFIFISEKLNELLEQKNKLADVIHSNGDIQWTKVIEILPQSEKCPFIQHPEISLDGTLPSHIPIIEINAQKNSHSILFVTEGGLFSRAQFKNSNIKEIFLKCLSRFKDPTWNELCTHLILPKQAHIAEVTAEEFLHIHQGYQNDFLRIKTMADFFIPS